MISIEMCTKYQSTSLLTFALQQPRSGICDSIKMTERILKYPQDVLEIFLVTVEKEKIK